MKKLIILATVIVLTGCRGSEPVSETFAHSYTENIEVEGIILEEIQINPIEIEPITFENSSVYWED